MAASDMGDDATYAPARELARPEMARNGNNLGVSDRLREDP